MDAPQLSASSDVFFKTRDFTRLAEAKASGLYPYFVPIESSTGTEVVIDGKRRVMIGSNNYLGLTHDPRVIAAAQAAIEKYGSACTGSRFLNGNTDLHDRIEVKLAELTGKEAGLVFSTGFQTNLGVIATLVGRTDFVYIDKLDHASIVDGCFLSAGDTVRFRHGDLDDLEAKLARGNRNGGGKLIVVDGVFSMEGDIVDLPRLVELCAQYDARLVVDDAHSIGVLGETGAGTAEHFGLTPQVDLIVGTFSKSFASIGGFVTGEREVIEYLKHQARALIFSASMPPSACAAVLTCLDIMAAEPERRQRLWENADYMRAGLRSLGYDTGVSETPIVPVIIGNDHLTFHFWRALFDNGVFTNPVVAPAVPEKESRIRTSYSATHTRDQLDFVLDVFAKVGRAAGVI
ncbi:MAG TPA: pyridoxal phosphate-dependent aminotransferase family protein [Gemmatimonadaceae bacterium]|jgi:8-amino-7-oxononanoate synthase|nr:pyridoxal phosphate-dependent aminotransferase family protein [Gemmatimonadaceae bacterium]